MDHFKSPVPKEEYIRDDYSGEEKHYRGVIQVHYIPNERYMVLPPPVKLLLESYPRSTDSRSTMKKRPQKTVIIDVANERVSNLLRANVWKGSLKALAKTNMIKSKKTTRAYKNGENDIGYLGDDTVFDKEDSNEN